MDKLELLAEADRRGILPDDKRALFDEAVKRGLIGAPVKADDSLLGQAKSAVAASPITSAVDAATSLASGAVAAPVAGLAGIAQGAKNLVSPGMSAADRVRQMGEALTYEPRTKGGKAVVGAVAYPFEKLAEGADIAGAKTAEVTGSPAAGAAVNTAIQSVPLVLGKVVGKIGRTTAEAEAAAATRKAASAQVDAGIKQAQDAGYILPPTQANPSILNQILEGVGGKIKTAQRASGKNQVVTNDLARQALGIAPGAPLSPDTLAAVRQQAGQAYEAVKGAGRVVTDDAYHAELNRIAQPTRNAAKDFKSLQNNEVEKVIQGLSVDSFDASSAIDQIKLLRAEADKAYRTGDKTLGSAYKDSAKALEEQIGRHLEASEQSPELLSDFQRAREIIAKSYTVQKALQTDGNVNAVSLARDLQKGKPLSGELKTAGEFASQFPKAAQLPEKVGGVPYSMLDAAVGGGVATLLHSPALIATATARPLLRALITSKTYQKALAGAPSHEAAKVIALRDAFAKAQSGKLVPLSEMSAAQRE